MFEQGSVGGIKRQRLAAFRAPSTPVQRCLGVGVGSNVIGAAIAQEVCDEDDVEQRGEVFYRAPTVVQHGDTSGVYSQAVLSFLPQA